MISRGYHLHILELCGEQPLLVPQLLALNLQTFVCSVVRSPAQFFFDKQISNKNFLLASTPWEGTQDWLFYITIHANIHEIISQFPEIFMKLHLYLSTALKFR
jgi:hypothetical protein